MCFAPQRRALFPHRNLQKWSEPLVLCTFWLGNDMCFLPQRRALFRHLNLQKWSENLVFWTFWLRNVLRATTACTFSTSQLPKVVRTWCVLYILTSKCASRHNGVHEPPKVVRTPSVLYILTSKCASRHNSVHFFDISTAKSGPDLVCFVHFDFEMCFAPQRRALFRHLNLQKWSGLGVLCTFWLQKCASRHNGVHFFDISTAKSGPDRVCFVHFDFEMCFTPQRRALFRHLNCQKWSGPSVLCTFWLWNVLRATTACSFATSQLPKVVRTWCVLYILTSKCASRLRGWSVLYILTSKFASRHNGVQFFISPLASCLRTRRFSEPTFRPSRTTIIGKTHCFATFLPFRASPSSFFLLFLFYSSLFWSFSSLGLCPTLLFICPYCREFDF